MTGSPFDTPLRTWKSYPDHHIGFAAEQKLHPVDLRSAHLDGDVETFLLVKAGRLCLIEAAVFGLGEPAGQEAHFIGSARGTGDERKCECGRKTGGGAA